jgi:hypothetical protein
MRRFRLLSTLALAFVGASAAFAQISGGFPGGGFPAGGGFPGGLAQQPGVIPGGRGFLLPSGGKQQIALLCTDLFAATPNHQTRMVAVDDRAIVRLADGTSGPLRDAMEHGWLVVRGRGPQDPPRIDGRAYFDVFVENRLPVPVQVEIPAGTVLSPAGQPTPKLPERVPALLAAATRRIEGDTPSYAVWAAREFTRADVEQTMMRRVSDREASLVQQWLTDAGFPHRFDRDGDSYAKLYETASAALGQATEFRGTALLATGGRARVEGRRTPDGKAVVTVVPARGDVVLRYRATVTGSKPGKLGLALRHLKTDRPIEANRGRLWVTLAE